MMLSQFLFAILIWLLQGTEIEAICGGVTADPTDFIFKAKIGTVNLRYCSIIFHKCGGTLVTDRHVLTAAHCIDNVHPLSIRVTLGTTKQDGSGGVTHTVKKFIPHENFRRTGSGMQHDIGIVVLNQLVHLNNRIGIAKLPEHPTEEGQVASTFGWGLLDIIRELPNDLQKLDDVYILHKDACELLTTVIRGRMIRNPKPKLLCGYNGNGRGTTNGDSGGGLIYENKFVVGIASRAPNRCGHHPDSYTPVYPYLDWIRRVTSSCTSSNCGVTP